MKFLIAIAMLALVGVSSTSAAAIDSGNNEMPDSMRVYESVLKSLLQDVSKLEKKQALILTEEEKGEVEPSTVEGNLITEDIGMEKMGCVQLKGGAAQCCFSVSKPRKAKICVGIKQYYHNPIWTLDYNDKVIWSNKADNSKFAPTCGKYDLLCFKLSKLELSNRKAKGCIQVSKIDGIKCNEKRCFETDEIPRTMKGLDSFNVHEEYIFNRPPGRYVLRFEA